MLLQRILLLALSLVVAQCISDVEDVSRLPSTTVSCQKAHLAEHVRRSQMRFSHLVSQIGSDPAEEQLLVSSYRFKRQISRGGMRGCGNEQLSQIMQHVVGPLLSVNQLRLGDIAQILQQSVQRATGKSFEILMGQGEMGVSSYQKSESASCKLRIGEYYTTVYETPVQYNIYDAEQEKILSNIDFGERLGGSGYPGQTPFPRWVEPQIEKLLNGLFVKRECFSGDLIVETIGGPKRMRELKTGDEVLSIDEDMISFFPILMFLHRDEEFLAEFIVITTAYGTVKLTSEHLIYVSDCDPNSPLRLVRAKHVTVDHCLMGARSPGLKLTDDRINNITKIHERGIYAPLTSTGDIIVNDILSSCHSNLGIRSLQDSLFKLYRLLSFLLPEGGALPIGLAYFTSALDLFIPVKEVVG